MTIIYPATTMTLSIRRFPLHYWRTMGMQQSLTTALRRQSCRSLATTTRTLVLSRKNHLVAKASHSPSQPWTNSTIFLTTRYMGTTPPTPPTTTTTTTSPVELSVMTEETRRIADLILASAQKAQTGHLAVDSHDSDNKNKTSNPLFHNHNNKKQMYAERQALAKAITLLESQSPKLQAQANALLLYLQRETAAATTTIPSIRIGLAGAPGAGKSTLVEALGKYLLSLPIPSSSSSIPDAFRIIPHRLGVVCVDPSSVVHGGSILGDKTRMPTLSAAHERVYVRPAPSTAGTLGGLAGERTHDTLALLTDYAGYNVCLLETVGLGQSEVEIAQCVDVTVLCIPPGGGDSLQGVKKGILEVADVLCVTKADGNLLAAAQSTAADYKGALQITDNMGGTLRRRVVLTSSETGQGLDQLWQAIESFVQERWESGAFDRKRTEQKDYWMWKSFNTLVQNYVQAKFPPQSSSSGAFAEDGDTLLPPRVAAARLLKNLVDANNGNL